MNIKQDTFTHIHKKLFFFFFEFFTTLVCVQQLGKNLIIRHTVFRFALRTVPQGIQKLGEVFCCELKSKVNVPELEAI